ncbi:MULTISPECIES: hypothetical protein [unclassified Mycobacterium]|uniref:hypothetical protein n=1 Tax=unclassified Mycobacterium TaxID=2642494 RepID=UPI00073FFAB4|nr:MULTISPECIES: hypothetical protein [unclassified Mycobacterium]KUH85962.1 hypothetical protein AU185_11585 [Mycobacterium sp. GA-0227b]KUH85976.1 hypothetical protein AU186_11055 [Mycobacterium sp. GA-1999]KUH87768.1 hypothetical protein AU187_04360 [Mycobacterium sp. IS-1556]
MTDSKTDTQEPTAAGTDPAGPPTEEPAEVPSEDSAAPPTADPADVPDEQASTGAKAPGRRRSISLSVRSVTIGVVIAVLVGLAGTTTWLYLGAQHKLDTQASESANNARAEKIALDYAVNAATMDFKDLQAWKVKLVAGTSPELNDELTKAAVSMEQILVPLEWTSTAQPLVAKVRSNSGGVFVVDCFVSVQTKTVQAPEALQSTATYSVTVDSNKDWQITDVGGIGSVIGPK